MFYIILASVKHTRWSPKRGRKSRQVYGAKVVPVLWFKIVHWNTFSCVAYFILYLLSDFFLPPHLSNHHTASMSMWRHSGHSDIWRHRCDLNTMHCEQDSPAVVSSQLTSTCQITSMGVCDLTFVDWWPCDSNWAVWGNALPDSLNMSWLKVSWYGSIFFHFIRNIHDKEELQWTKLKGLIVVGIRNT